MRAHCLQHVPFEGLGSIEPWLEAQGYEVTRSRLYHFDELPNVEDIDLLIVMGGPMSVNDEKEYPWLVDEKKFIKTAIQSGKSTLGICLGAQLIADSMGGKVFPNSNKEIGWFPVQAVKPGHGDVFQFPETLDVFHWHGETFSLPDGAVRLAESEACKNQAFQIGANVIGLQFHLEITAYAAQEIVKHCSHELVEGEYIQTEADILNVSEEQYHSINRQMAKVLEYLRWKSIGGA